MGDSTRPLRVDTTFPVNELFTRKMEEVRDYPDDVRMETVMVSSQPRLMGQENCMPVIPSISVSATHQFKKAELYGDCVANGYIYHRLGSHSTEAAAHVINNLEGGEGATLFSSGMSAITTTFLAILKSGDHVIVPDPVYAGVFTFFKHMAGRYGIESTFVPACEIEEYRKAIKPNTKLFFGETPTNPTIGVLDLDAFAALTKSVPNAISMVDSTFASPYNVQTLRHGIDIVVHSTTKYLGGHHDHMGGVMCSSDPKLFFYISEFQKQLGTIQGAFDAFLLMRGIKTLAVRMEKHATNAMKVATFLEGHPKVAKVYYPGLKSHPYHEVAKKQMKTFGGMVTFIMHNKKSAEKLVDSLKIILLAVSLGGIESLVEHPASMTHGPYLMTDEERKKGGIDEGLIRFSVGIEDGDDLVNDLKQALEKV
ncbi:L-methionine gamma-lyase-like [Apostichopus japonicus]|uniref:L-methionine gamma-lyase-like n=1 Tax=Stichopus japonicus TaxID=307972 RepID=UPI003AB1C150